MKIFIPLSAALVLVTASFAFIFLIATPSHSENVNGFYFVESHLNENSKMTRFAVPDFLKTSEFDLGKNSKLLGLPSEAKILFYGQGGSTGLTLISFQRKINFELLDFAKVYAAVIGFEVSESTLINRNDRDFLKILGRSSSLPGTLLISAFGENVFIFSAEGERSEEIVDLAGLSFEFDDSASNYLGSLNSQEIVGNTFDIPLTENVRVDSTNGKSLNIFRENPDSNELVYLISASPSLASGENSIESATISSLRKLGYDVTPVEQSEHATTFALTKDGAHPAVGHMVRKDDLGYFVVAIYPELANDPDAWMEARFYLSSITK